MRRYIAGSAPWILVITLACGGEGGGETVETPQAPAAAEPAAPAPAPAAAEPAAPAQAPAPADLPEGVTAEMVQAGSTLFAGSVCTACHGPQGGGVQGIGPDLTDSTWLTGDGSFASIAQVITEGVPVPVEHPGPMPPMGGNLGLTVQQVRELAAYVYSISRAG